MNKLKLNDIKKYCELHDEVFCYGAGRYGKIVRVYLDECGVSVRGFITTCVDSDYTSVLELPVYTAGVFLKEKHDGLGIIVAMSPEKQKDVTDLLDLQGVSDYICVDDEIMRNMESECSFKHRYCSKNNITVFCFHRVADLPIDTWKLAVSPRLFEKQVNYIKENYLVLRSEEDWSIAENKRAAVITFDDGYEDSLVNALPILEKYEAPATVFICTGNIDTEKEFWWDELERIIFFSKKGRMNFEILGSELALESDDEKRRACYELHPLLKKMGHVERKEYLHSLEIALESSESRDYCRSLNSKQLKALSESPIITIGGHTVTHSCLANESSEMQDYEIKESKEVIEGIINKPLHVFSYPFGQPMDYNDETIKIVQKYGYKRIFSAFPGITNNEYTNGHIPRINIGQETDFSSSIKLLRRFETLL